MNINNKRNVILDTETTGMNKLGIHYEGHKIIEIGAVEIINRRLTGNQFHVYLNPNRSIDREAYAIHGISDEFLMDKPMFSNIADKFLDFISGSELVIHNALFDLGFLDFELKSINLNYKRVESYCTIVDTLKLARKMFPGQRNSLDALCERYAIDNSKRALHNALIDAQILANVFLSMTGGQTKMQFTEIKNNINELQKKTNNLKIEDNINMEKSLKIFYATTQEILEHEKYLDFLEKFNINCVWRKINS